MNKLLNFATFLFEWQLFSSLINSCHSWVKIIALLDRFDCIGLIFSIADSVVSAADCVTAGATKVIQMGVADEKRIGLFGHSFGGYETNFILTQTNLFSTAISGNGVSDVVAHYFNYNNDFVHSVSIN